MEKLTLEGRRAVSELAQKHGFSDDAVTHMLFAVLHGNGAMAQFNHPDFAGSGQWMRGGMLMLSDMFNHSLKARVDALCNDISGLLAREPGLLPRGSFQSQQQSGGGQQSSIAGGSSLFVPDPEAHWWPPELGQPNAVGSQNGVRYAYFAPAKRLAVEVGGRIRVYDTMDHRIGGFSQQQGGGSTVTFTSQHGTVALSSLPEVSAAHRASTAAPEGAMPAAAARQESATTDDVFSAIERLGKLRDDGLLTDGEFAEKKTELLRRI